MKLDRVGAPFVRVEEDEKKRGIDPAPVALVRRTNAEREPLTIVALEVGSARLHLNLDDQAGWHPGEDRFELEVDADIGTGAWPVKPPGRVGDSLYLELAGYLGRVSRRDSFLIVQPTDAPSRRRGGLPPLWSILHPWSDAERRFPAQAPLGGLWAGTEKPCNFKWRRRQSKPSARGVENGRKRTQADGNGRRFAGLSGKMRPFATAIRPDATASVYQVYQVYQGATAGLTAQRCSSRSAWFGTKGSQVQILSPRLSNRPSLGDFPGDGRSLSGLRGAFRGALRSRSLSGRGATLRACQRDAARP